MENKQTFNFPEGEMLLINKPFKWTSFDVVNKIRWLLQRKLGFKNIKVGHAGTLDPLATGLLIICTGKFTKKIVLYQAMEKEYTGTITLGASTPSFDLETAIDKTFPVEHISEEIVISTAKEFVGTINQVPPLFSAKKIDGERAYEKARRGEKIEVKPSEITISKFEITGIRMPEVDFRIVCSKGTYIRSIAHDFGKALKSGGYLSALCRSGIGSYNIAQSFSIEEIEKKLEDFALSKL